MWSILYKEIILLIVDNKEPESGGRAEPEPERGREQGAREGESEGGRGNAFAKLFSSIHFGSYWEVSKIDRSITIDGLATAGLE